MSKDGAILGHISVSDIEYSNIGIHPTTLTPQVHSTLVSSADLKLASCRDLESTNLNNEDVVYYSIVEGDVIANVDVIQGEQIMSPNPASNVFTQLHASSPDAKVMVNDQILTIANVIGDVAQINEVINESKTNVACTLVSGVEFKLGFPSKLNLANYTLHLPANQGNASTTLINDGSGQLSWGNTIETAGETFEGVSGEIVVSNDTTWNQNHSDEKKLIIGLATKLDNITPGQDTGVRGSASEFAAITLDQNGRVIGTTMHAVPVIPTGTVALVAGTGLNGGGNFDRDVATEATTVADGSFVPGKYYKIKTVGDTNWTTAGWSGITAQVGDIFLATTAGGAGTGTADVNPTEFTFSLAAPGAAATTKGTSTNSAVVAVDANGLVTSLTETAIAFPSAAVTVSGDPYNSNIGGGGITVTGDNTFNLNSATAMNMTVSMNATNVKPVGLDTASGSFEVGVKYEIVSANDTDFIAEQGASSNNVGTKFVAISSGTAANGTTIVTAGIAKVSKYGDSKFVPVLDINAQGLVIGATHEAITGGSTRAILLESDSIVINRDSNDLLVLTGTLSIASGVAALTGVNTKFEEELVKGCTVSIGGTDVVVLAVTGQETATLTATPSVTVSSSSATTNASSFRLNSEDDVKIKLDLPDVGTAGLKGSASQFVNFTTDAKGRIVSTVLQSFPTAASVSNEVVTITAEGGLENSTVGATSDSQTFTLNQGVPVVDGNFVVGEKYAITSTGTTTTWTDMGAVDGNIGTEFTAAVVGTIASFGDGEAKRVYEPIKLGIKANGIVTSMIGALQVTATEIAEDAITNAKLANDAVNTDEITNLAVTSVKLAQTVQDDIIGAAQKAAANAFTAAQTINAAATDATHSLIVTKGSHANAVNALKISAQSGGDTGVDIAAAVSQKAMLNLGTTSKPQASLVEYSGASDSMKMSLTNDTPTTTDLSSAGVAIQFTSGSTTVTGTSTSWSTQFAVGDTLIVTGANSGDPGNSQSFSLVVTGSAPSDGSMDVDSDPGQTILVNAFTIYRVQKPGVPVSLTLSSSGIELTNGVIIDGGITASGNIALTGANRSISGLVNPVGDSHAVNKAYVDARSSGLYWLRPVNLVGFTPITMNSSNPQMDGVSLSSAHDGMRILLTAQTDARENGIWVFRSSGNYERPTEGYTTGAKAKASAVFVKFGTTFADTAWVQTADGRKIRGQSDLTETGVVSLVSGTDQLTISDAAGFADVAKDDVLVINPGGSQIIATVLTKVNDTTVQLTGVVNSTVTNANWRYSTETSFVQFSANGFLGKNGIEKDASIFHMVNPNLYQEGTPSTVWSSNLNTCQGSTAHGSDAGQMTLYKGSAGSPTVLNAGHIEAALNVTSGLNEQDAQRAVIDVLFGCFMMNGLPSAIENHHFRYTIKFSGYNPVGTDANAFKFLPRPFNNGVLKIQKNGNNPKDSFELTFVSDDSHWDGCLHDGKWIGWKRRGEYGYRKSWEMEKEKGMDGVAALVDDTFYPVVFAIPEEVGSNQAFFGRTAKFRLSSRSDDASSTMNQNVLEIEALSGARGDHDDGGEQIRMRVSRYDDDENGIGPICVGTGDFNGFVVWIKNDSNVTGQVWTAEWNWSPKLSYTYDSTGSTPAGATHKATLTEQYPVLDIQDLTSGQGHGGSGTSASTYVKPSLASNFDTFSGANQSSFLDTSGNFSTFSTATGDLERYGYKLKMIGNGAAMPSGEYHYNGDSVSGTANPRYFSMLSHSYPTDLDQKVSVDSNSGLFTKRPSTGVASELTVSGPKISFLHPKRVHGVNTSENCDVSITGNLAISEAITGQESKFSSASTLDNKLLMQAQNASVTTDYSTSGGYFITFKVENSAGGSSTGETLELSRSGTAIAGWESILNVGDLIRFQDGQNSSLDYTLTVTEISSDTYIKVAETGASRSPPITADFTMNNAASQLTYEITTVPPGVRSNTTLEFGSNNSNSYMDVALLDNDLNGSTSLLKIEQDGNDATSGKVTVLSTKDASNSQLGGLTVVGGAAIAQKCFVGNTLTCSKTGGVGLQVTDQANVVGVLTCTAQSVHSGGIQVDGASTFSNSVTLLAPLTTEGDVTFKGAESKFQSAATTKNTFNMHSQTTESSVEVETDLTPPTSIEFKTEVGGGSSSGSTLELVGVNTQWDTELSAGDRLRIGVTGATDLVSTGRQITVTNGSTTLTGSSTTWNTIFSAGDQIRINGRNIANFPDSDVVDLTFTVSVVNSDTDITVTSAHTGLTRAINVFTSYQKIDPSITPVTYTITVAASPVHNATTLTATETGASLSINADFTSTNSFSEYKSFSTPSAVDRLNASIEFGNTTNAAAGSDNSFVDFILNHADKGGNESLLKLELPGNTEDSGVVTLASTKEVTALNNGALVVNGGASIAKSLIVGNTLTCSKMISIETSGHGLYFGTGAILPLDKSGTFTNQAVHLGYSLDPNPYAFAGVHTYKVVNGSSNVSLVHDGNITTTIGGSLLTTINTTGLTIAGKLTCGDVHTYQVVNGSSNISLALDGNITTTIGGSLLTTTNTTGLTIAGKLTCGDLTLDLNHLITSGRWIEFWPGANRGVGIDTYDNSIPGTECVQGREYTILTTGTSDFTTIGAASNTVGVTFVASPRTLTGTVSMTDDTAVLSGNSTLFTTELQVGSTIKISSQLFQIAAITSDTAATTTTKASSTYSGLTFTSDGTFGTGTVNGHTTLATHLQLGRSAFAWGSIWDKSTFEHCQMILGAEHGHTNFQDDVSNPRCKLLITGQNNESVGTETDGSDGAYQIYVEDENANVDFYIQTISNGSGGATTSKTYVGGDLEVNKKAKIADVLNLPVGAAPTASTAGEIGDIRLSNSSIHVKLATGWAQCNFDP